MYKLFGIICLLIISLTVCFAQFPIEEAWHVELDSAYFLGPNWQDEDGISHFLICNRDSNTVSIISEAEEIWESQELPGLITAIHRVDFGVGDGPEIIVGTYADTGRVVALSGEAYENLEVREVFFRAEGEHRLHRTDDRYITFIDNFENILPDSSKSLIVGNRDYQSEYIIPEGSTETTIMDQYNIMFDIDEDQSEELIVALYTNHTGELRGGNIFDNTRLDLQIYNSQLELGMQRQISGTRGYRTEGVIFLDLVLIPLPENNSFLATSHYFVEITWDGDDPEVTHRETLLDFLTLDSLSTIGERMSLGENQLRKMETVVNAHDESVFLVCLMSGGSLIIIDVEEQMIVDSFDEFAFSDFDIGQFDDDEELEMVTLSTNRFTFYDLGELSAPSQPPPNQITGFVLHAAFPNPFNAQTVIPFDLASPSNVKVLAYDQSGRLVETLIDKQFSIGSHSIAVDASQYSSGNYFIKVVTDRGYVSQKITMIK